MTNKVLDANGVDADTFLKTLSTEDFLTFGVHDVAYIRAVSAKDGEMAYAIHAADGTPLSIMDSFDSAMMAIKQNDLKTATIQ